MRPSKISIICLATVAQVLQAQACLPTNVPLAERRSKSTVVFQGKIINTHTVERDFKGSKQMITLGIVKVTKVIKGDVPSTMIVSHPATSHTSCDHVGTLEKQKAEGIVLEFTLGWKGQDVEPEPRVDYMINMWPVRSQ